MADEIRRERTRRPALRINRKEIADRVIVFASEDQQQRTEEQDARLQRYAKFRQWTEGKDWPWENSSDIAFGDLTAASLSVQDTLHNAVMSTRPPVISKSLHKNNQEKQEIVDNTLDFQFFVEQAGEKTLEELVDAFVKRRAR
jgi:hypothetical protein